MFRRLSRRRGVQLGLAGIGIGALLAATALVAHDVGPGGSAAVAADCSIAPGADPSDCTSTPIKHVVVIFPENESFDHYFATYPYAVNGTGETPFTASPDTPTGIDTELNAGLIPSSVLPDHNPNDDPEIATAVDKDPNATSNPSAPNPNANQPTRLAPTVPIPSGNSHDYSDEQTRIDNGKMDQFVANPMGYYDGNTVTALWNYAQNFAMSDNSWDATFGPSTPGALNLISGQTYISPSNGTMTGDTDAFYDDCGGNGSNGQNGSMAGANIGDLLTAKNITWGWFGGGFKATSLYNGTTVTKSSCGETTPRIGDGSTQSAYSSHHTPFEYYLSTSNPHHYPGTPGVAIGANDAPNNTTHTGANHEYDTSDFDAAAASGALPAVSFIKPPVAQDAHPGNSGPVDEASFLVKTINEIEQSPEWNSTAIIISYDDSDGWYDHAAPTILNGSNSGGDGAICTTATAAPLNGITGRCGPSQRLPFLVISPYARHDYVDHTEITQPSILKFIENNWLGDERIDQFMQAHSSASPYQSPNGPVSYTSAALGSFDASAGSIDAMFDFAHPAGWTAILNPVSYNVPKKTCDCGSVSVAEPAPQITTATTSMNWTAGTTPTTSDIESRIQPTTTEGTLSFDTSAVDFDTAGSYPLLVNAVNSYGIAATPVTITVKVKAGASSQPSTTPSPTASLSLARTTVDIPASHQASTAAAIATLTGAQLNVSGSIGAELSRVQWDAPGDYAAILTAAPDNGAQLAPVPITIHIAPAASATTLTVSKSSQTYGAKSGLQALATVTGGDGDPTGKVTFKVDGKAVKTVSLLKSTAVLRLPTTIAPGSRKLTASYVSNEAASASSASAAKKISVVKAASKTTLKAKPASVGAGKKLTVTIAVTGHGASGKVKLYDGTHLKKTLTLGKKGTATVLLVWAKSGTHKLYAAYAGSSKAKTSTSKKVTVTIKAPRR